MDNNNAEHACIFEWRILNPFVPWEGLKATFYSFARTLIQWTVTVEPMGRGMSNWIFVFCLKAEEFDEFDEIQTHRVQIEMLMNERRFLIERVPNYCFDSSNHHRYHFLTHAATRPIFGRPELVIRLEIYLPAAPPLKTPRPVSWYEEDQMQLSEDLNELLHSDSYRNMRLFPNDYRDAYDILDVHSCIIDARWNNFFRIHSSANDNAPVVINISSLLLKIIIQYMYSGRFSDYWPKWKEISRIVELFEVIDRYKLYHLYKVFAKSDSEQLRYNARDITMNGCHIPLDGGSISTILEVDYQNEFFFALLIKVVRQVHEIEISYSMEFIRNVRRRIHVLVNFQFEKRFSRQGLRTIRIMRSVHEQDHYVDQGEMHSGEEVFPLYGEIFDDFILGNRSGRDGRRIDHFLKCVVYLSDGNTVMQVMTIADDTMQSERQRFSVLGDHMHGLLIMGRDSDLRIMCRNKHDDEEAYPAHKAIFSTRVPKYWRVLRNVRRNSDIPSVVTCSFSSEAFRHILFYIYTGKILKYPFPSDYMDEVYRFAQESEFNALMNLVNRMRGR